VSSAAEKAATPRLRDDGVSIARRGVRLRLRPVELAGALPVAGRRHHGRRLGRLPVPPR